MSDLVSAEEGSPMFFEYFGRRTFSACDTSYDPHNFHGSKLEFIETGSRQ
jgi:hypothetical protein